MKIRKHRYKQVGKSNYAKDKKRRARVAGWRQAKTSGRWYFENRKNRSDVPRLWV